jgi:hypothetical protein
MARVTWTLRRERPCVEVHLTLAVGGQNVRRTLLADTGAGARKSRFELILDEDDCLLCCGNPAQSVVLGGAYTGAFPRYTLPVSIPALGFDADLRAIGVPTPPAGFDGIAGFAFLNRFTYGNFGDPAQFGLEC